jgi:hypothetical protein
MKKQDVIDVITNNSLNLIPPNKTISIDFLLGGGVVSIKAISTLFDYRENFVVLDKAKMGYGDSLAPYKTILLEYDKILGIAFS